MVFCHVVDQDSLRGVGGLVLSEERVFKSLEFGGIFAGDEDGAGS